MSKTTGRTLFGRGNRGQTVTVIEPATRHNQRRKAVVAFWVCLVVVGLLTGTVASHYLHPILGGLLGLAVGAVVGLVVGALIVVWPVLRIIWHWLPEIGIGTGLVYGWTALMTSTPLWLSLVSVGVLVGVPAAVGPLRRGVVALFWCLVVRHRLRLCFAAFIATNRHGTLPLILPARPTPAGERVWIWLRPGLSLRDLEQEGQVQKLAVACWAREVRVMRASRRYAALVRVDVTRREPLAATVVSPLPDYVPADMPGNAPVSPAVPPVGVRLTEVPDLRTTAAPSGDAPRPRRTRNPAPPTEPPAFDPRDYA